MSLAVSKEIGNAVDSQPAHNPKLTAQRSQLLFFPSRFRQLPRDPAIEGGVLTLPLILERQRGQLDRVENVAEIQLGNRSYRFVGHLTARARRSLACAPARYRRWRSRSPRWP